MDAANLRNVALLSHSGAGKTSLAEAVLFDTKAVTRLGNIEDGNTLSDFEPEEIKRGSSIQTTLISALSDGFKINYLDTPGYEDFQGEVMAALRGSRFGMVWLPNFHLPTGRRRRDWQHNVRRQSLRIAVNPSNRRKRPLRISDLSDQNN